MGKPSYKQLWEDVSRGRIAFIFMEDYMAPRAHLYCAFASSGNAFFGVMHEWSLCSIRHKRCPNERDWQEGAQPHDVVQEVGRDHGQHCGDRDGGGSQLCSAAAVVRRRERERRRRHRQSGWSAGKASGVLLEWRRSRQASVNWYFY